MSDFVGIIRWGDDRRLERRDAERLSAAIGGPGLARPVSASIPPFHAAFRQVIITPEDQFERQPAVAGNVVSLFAGRLDDRDSTASRLALSQADAPDGMIALAAFHRWGVEAAQELVGEFAWVVWDGGRQRLVLARDISPAQTLYVFRTEHVVAFATNLRALFALPDIPRQIDDEGLADLVALNPAMGVRTVYRDVERVMPGTTLVIERGRPASVIPWRPRPCAAPRTPDDCAAAAREVFGRAMQSRLRALGPTAVSLSGGLDSSIVAADAAIKRAPDPVLAFVLVPEPGVPLAVRPWEAPDDREQVDALARRYPNLHVHLVEPGADALDADPTAIFVETGHPVTVAPSLTWTHAAWRAAKASGVRLMLTGGDGEMSLTHYGSLRAVVQQGDPWHALREAWRGAKRKQGRFLGNLDRAFLGSGISHLRNRDGHNYPGNWSRYAALNPDFAAATGVRDRLLAEGFPRGRVHAKASQRELVMRTLRWRAAATEGIAVARRLSGMAYSSPFSDRRVVEFCLSLPESMFIRDGWPRWLARAAFHDILPTEVRERTVKAVQNGEWFHRMSFHRDAYRQQLERIETSPLAARALDLPRLKGLLDTWPSSADDAEAAGPDYRATLVRGLHVGAFLRWFDPGNSG